MGVVVRGVQAGSPAQCAGFLPGDVLAAVDGHPIADVLDYRFYTTASRFTAEGETAAGEPFRRPVRKDQYDDLGLEFDTYLMDRQRACRNKCVFCFIDQLPQGLRESLYFKDDDSRLGFLFGNYVTLTNLEERDIARILEMHISPVNVSVHTMNPRLRVEMMKNPRAGEVLAYLPRLVAGGIRVNAQLVLCPGLNDGPELTRSLRELCALAPGLQSVAVVPVGLTRHRAGLHNLRLHTKGEAARVLRTVEEFGDEMLAVHGRRTCFAADEFYLRAGETPPAAAHYGDFDQLENGVGLVALLRDEFAAALEDMSARQMDRRVTLATGVAAAPLIRQLAHQACARFPGLEVDVVPVRNDFLGESITVAGLVAGGDLLRQLDRVTLGDQLLIPAVMLRREGDLFLDGLHLDTLTRELKLPVRPVPNDGWELLNAFLGLE